MTKQPAVSLENILIVDSDDNIAELLRVNLAGEGYGIMRLRRACEVDCANLGDTVLVIADSMDEDYSGMDLASDLRDNPRTEHIGVILYSPFNGSHTVIEALDSGADDYIVKPFSLREMVARVRSVLRRRAASKCSAATGGNIVFENLIVDLISRTVRIGGAVLSLTPTEYAILVLLLKRVNTYVPRTEIHRRVWHDAIGAGANGRIVDTNISRLRKKLGTLGGRIVSRTGHGYMLS